MWPVVADAFGLEVAPPLPMSLQDVMADMADMFADTSKSRRYGFHAYVDTEAMLLALFDDLRKRRIIPG
jgi:hypothetical protein